MRENGGKKKIQLLLAFVPLRSFLTRRFDISLHISARLLFRIQDRKISKDSNRFLSSSLSAVLSRLCPEREKERETDLSPDNTHPLK